MPDEEEIEPDFLDFEEESSDSRETPGAEDTPNTETGSGRENKGTSPSESSDRPEAGSIDDNLVQKAKEFFHLPETRSSKPKRGTKRRRSSSSSVSKDDGEKAKQRTSKKQSYISPAKIAKIFNNAIAAKNLCLLSTMENGTPLDIERLMPDATVAQICAICDLWENPANKAKERRIRKKRKSRRKKSSSRRSSKRRRRAKSRSSSKSSRTKKTKSENDGGKSKSESLDLKAAFPVPTSTKEC